MELHNGYLNWSGHGKDFNVDVKPVSRPIKSLYEETVSVAETIWSQKQGKLQLCYSGGIDSEYVLAVLLSLGMSVEPVIMRTQYNHHETDYALKYCEQRNLTPTIINLDYDKFVESGELFEICDSVKAAAFHYGANMWLCSQLDGTVITGDMNPHLILHNDKWYVDEMEPVYTQIDYFKKHNIYGTPFFMTYTAEQYTAFLVDPTINQLAQNLIPGKTGSNSSKFRVYNNQSFFVLEDRTKRHGYEIVETSPIYNHPDIQAINSWKEEYWGTKYFEYFEFTERLLNGYDRP